MAHPLIILRELAQSEAFEVFSFAMFTERGHEGEFFSQASRIYRRASRGHTYPDRIGCSRPGRGWGGLVILHVQALESEGEALGVRREVWL